MNRKLAWFYLFCVSFLIFGVTLSYDFIFLDDNVNIYSNTWIETRKYFNFLHQSYYGMYIPVTYLIWSLLCIGKFPPHPFLFHFANVFFHSINSILIFELIRKLLGKTKPSESSHSTNLSAALGATLFCVHPLQVETVAWVSNFRDILSTTLGLSSLLFFITLPSKRNLVLTLSFFFLSMLAKPTSLVLPLIFLGMSYSVYCNPIKRHLPLTILGLTASLLILRITQLAQGFSMQPLPISVPIKIGILIDTLGFYLIKLFYPWPLSADYGRTPDWVLANQSYLATCVPVLALISVIFCLRKKLTREWLLGPMIFTILLLPVLGLVPFSHQTVSTVADHYIYFPMFGAALLLSQTHQTLPPKRYTLPIALALAIYAFMSVTRMGDWKDDRTVVQDMYKKNPESIAALITLGNLASGEKQYALALTYYRKAVLKSPQHPVALSNYALNLVRAGRYQETIDEILPRTFDSSTLKPDSIIWPYLAAQYSSIGIAQMELGQLQESYNYLCKALKIAPNDLETVAGFEKLKIHFQKQLQKEPAPCPIQP